MDKFWIIMACADILVGIIDLIYGQPILGIAMIFVGFILIFIEER